MTTHEKPFWWFQGASVQELVRRLMAAGPDAILEVHLTGTQMTLEVVSGDEVSTESHVPPINDSHACPPDCH